MKITKEVKKTKNVVNNKFKCANYKPNEYMDFTWFPQTRGTSTGRCNKWVYKEINLRISQTPLG